MTFPWLPVNSLDRKNRILVNLLDQVFQSINKCAKFYSDNTNIYIHQYSTIIKVLWVLHMYFVYKNLLRQTDKLSHLIQ